MIPHDPYFETLLNMTPEFLMWGLDAHSRAFILEWSLGRSPQKLNAAPESMSLRISDSITAAAPGGHLRIRERGTAGSMGKRTRMGRRIKLVSLAQSIALYSNGSSN